MAVTATTARGSLWRSRASFGSKGAARQHSLLTGSLLLGFGWWRHKKVEAHLIYTHADIKFTFYSYLVVIIFCPWSPCGVTSWKCR